MKRILALLLCLGILLCGCAKKEDNTGTIPAVVPDVTQAPEAEIMTALAAVSVPATTENFCLEDGTEIFSYSYQHMSLIFPDGNVANKITLDFLNRVDATRPESETILKAAQANCETTDPWFPYFYRVLYSPVRMDHGVMSLFGTQSSFNGGMHSNISAIAVNYDMMTGDVLTFGSIMHPDAEKESFIQLVLEKLEAVKEDYYLYDDFEIAVRARLGGDENLYEDFFFTQTGLNFFFSPYEIAPYASGIISVEIPYSELPGLIYDGYFPAERQVVNGKMKSGIFMKTDMTRFNNMAEVILSDGKDLRVVYPMGSVEDIRISIAADGMTMPAYTVFAALEMSDKDAVVLNIPDALLEGTTVTYQSGGEEFSIGIS